MIYLCDFQPLSIAKIKKFSSTTGFLQKIFSDKVQKKASYQLIKDFTFSCIKVFFTAYVLWILKLAKDKAGRPKIA